MGRRSLLQLLGAVGSGVALSNHLPGTATAAAGTGHGGCERQTAAYLLRARAAYEQTLARPVIDLPTNGDEQRYEDKIAAYSKGLPHDDLGEVDLDAYDALLDALESGDYADVPLGGSRLLENPAASRSFNLEGLDPHNVFIDAPPAFATAETAAEMVELYWMALLRDVPFDEYGDDPLAQAAAAELSTLDDYTGPTEGGDVTAETLFRGTLDGSLDGPYLSQFFYKDIQRGRYLRDQRFSTFEPGMAFMTDYDEWLAIQNGDLPAETNEFTDEERYAITGRDLACWVFRDVPHQAFLNAAIILLNAGVPFDSGNPYDDSRGGQSFFGPSPTRDGTAPSPPQCVEDTTKQTSFIDYGFADVLSAVTGVVTDIHHAAWYHKWQVHRRLRPEAYGGRVFNHLSGRSTYPIPDQLLDSAAVARTAERFGSSLLPQAYAEGSPMHPSFPAGHDSLGGACVTVLKAYFDGSATIPDPVRPTDDGSALESISADLTVEKELNKLAENHSIGRLWAGIHYRSDSATAHRMGERFAIHWLEDRLRTRATPGRLSFTSFDGEEITITGDLDVDSGDLPGGDDL